MILLIKMQKRALVTFCHINAKSQGIFLILAEVKSVKLIWINLLPHEYEKGCFPDTLFLWQAQKLKNTSLLSLEKKRNFRLRDFR